MNTYKHESTRKAVEAVYNFFEKLEGYREELKSAKENHGSGSVYHKKALEIQREFENTQLETFAAIENAAKEAKNRAAMERAKLLSVGNAEKDFALLALPVKLTSEELHVMVKRNEGNFLFARAVGEYAEKNGIEDRTLLSLKAASYVYDDAVAAADTFEKALKNYCDGSSVTSVKLRYADAMPMLEKTNVFNNL